MSPVTARIRVLVVEDSLTVRQRLCEVIAGDPELELAGDCSDGQRAIELCRLHRPDVITMDMMLPGVSGLAATEHIMAHFPTPILIVSSSTNRGELLQTYQALAAGAVDVLEKPRGDEPEGEWEARFLARLKLVSRIRVITHLRGRLAGHGSVSQPVPVIAGGPGAADAPHELIAIGASTGGPAAIVDVLRALPATVDQPVLLVLHIGEPFGAAFADWLTGMARRPVVHPATGTRLASLRGRVAMAPPGRHLIVRGGAVHLADGPERHSCRPSIDVLFESIALACGARTIAALLTGMGRDGASGLLAIRRAGGHTLAQDEATSVVYGMPREAALLGAAIDILPLPQLGPAIAALAQAGGPRGGEEPR
ncbi:MAG TPA: chemotaxis-specific protein-glutamate methyltransferase CheB [Kofleriaceae bacterium]|nr:chemotaxis-specific protein-glutamate methyltransferase CheB [Kofleriaceae bacterium]